MNTGASISTTNKVDGGLLAAWVLDGAGGGRQLQRADIDTWKPEDGILWLHVDFDHDETLGFLHDISGLPSNVADALCLDETRPRVDIIDDGLLIILRAVNTNPGAEPDDMVSVRVWLEHNRVITSRRRRLRSLQDVQDNLGKRNGPSGAGEFLVQLIDRIGLRTSEVISGLEDAIDALEEQAGAERQSIAQQRTTLSQLRRQGAVLRRHIAPQRDALERLSREASSVLSDHLRMELREEADKFRRYVEDLDLARERAMVVHDHMQAMIAEEQNQRMFILSIVAAIFLPLSFVTGLMGMNVGGIPGNEFPNAFTLIVAGMLVVSIGLFLLFRRRRWI